MKKTWIVACLLAVMCLSIGAAAGAESAHCVVLPLPECAMLISPSGEALTERGAYADIRLISHEDVEGENQLFIATPSYDEVASGLSLLMNSKGQALTEPVYDDLIHEGDLIRFQQNGLWGIMNMERKAVAPAMYQVLEPNGEGGYLALGSDPYDDTPDGVYYVDASGVETATGARVSSGLGNFSEGLCTATSAESGRVGYLDAQGNWAISAQFEYGGDFKNDRAEACIESGYGIIDRKGNWLLTPKYTLVSTGFGDGNIILASQGSREVLMIDPRSYQVKKTFEGDEIYFGAYFDRDYAVLYTMDKVRLIDEEGTVLMETVQAGNFDAWYRMGARIIKREGPWGEVNNYLCDVAGKVVAGPYRELSLMCNDDQGNAYFGFSDFEVKKPGGAETDYFEMYEVPNTRKGGLIDQDGKVRIELGKFERLEEAGVGRLIAETDREMGIVDVDGEWIVKYPKAVGES